MRKHGPNKVVARFRAKYPETRPGHNSPPRPISDFVEWLTVKARAGVRYESVEQARAIFKIEQEQERQ